MGYSKKNKLHIVAITAVVINNKGQILIVKRSLRETAYPGRWALPGGKMENNQTVMKTLKDECREEVGLEIKDKKVCLDDSAFVRPDLQTVKVFSYLVWAKNFEVRLNPDDFSDYRWVGENEVDKYKVIGMDRKKLIKLKKYLSNS